MVKKIIAILLILLLIIITSCQTTNYSIVEYTLPEKPIREKIIVNPSCEEEYILIIIYYEHLVQLWEQWAQDVEKIISVDKKD